jgi:hypothetical protein
MSLAVGFVRRFRSGFPEAARFAGRARSDVFPAGRGKADRGAVGRGGACPPGLGSRDSRPGCRPRKRLVNFQQPSRSSPLIRPSGPPSPTGGEGRHEESSPPVGGDRLRRSQMRGPARGVPDFGMTARAVGPGRPLRRHRPSRSSPPHPALRATFPHQGGRALGWLLRSDALGSDPPSSLVLLSSSCQRARTPSSAG